MPKKKSSVKIDELQVINDIASLFSSTLSLKDTLQETIDLISKITKADACFLYLLNPVEGDLVLSASKTPHPLEVGRLKIKMGEGITGWVAQNLKSVALSEGAQNDSRFIGLLAEDVYEAMLSVPIQIKGKVVGVLNAQHKKSHAFPERLINLIGAIGSQIGGAIETARLYEETQKRAKTLEALNAVSHSLGSGEYEEILKMIIDMTAKMMRTHICSVMLLDEKKQELKIAASQSLDPEYTNKPPVKVNGSLSGKAVKTKMPVYVRDVRKDASFQFQEIANKQGLVSMLSVPMIYKNKVVGLLNSYTAEEYNFTKDEISFSQSIANQCAAAIENTRLLKEKLAAQEALEARKIIDRAKGILMKNKNLTEQEAFREIQRQSMDRRKSMKEICEAILLAFDMTN